LHVTAQTSSANVIVVQAVLFIFLDLLVEELFKIRAGRECVADIVFSDLWITKRHQTLARSMLWEGSSNYGPRAKFVSRSHFVNNERIVSLRKRWGFGAM